MKTKVLDEHVAGDIRSCMPHAWSLLKDRHCVPGDLGVNNAVCRNLDDAWTSAKLELWEPLLVGELEPVAVTGRDLIGSMLNVKYDGNWYKAAVTHYNGTRAKVRTCLHRVLYTDTDEFEWVNLDGHADCKEEKVEYGVRELSEKGEAQQAKMLRKAKAEAKKRMVVASVQRPVHRAEIFSANFSQTSHFSLMKKPNGEKYKPPPANVTGQVNLRNFAMTYVDVMFSGRNNKKPHPKRLDVKKLQEKLGPERSAREYPTLSCPWCSYTFYCDKAKKDVTKESRHCGSPRCYLTPEDDKAFLEAFLYREGTLYSKSLSKLQKEWNDMSGSLVQVIEDKDEDEDE